MKKIFVIIFSALALASCVIEEEVISSSKPSTYYQTVPQCITGLNGCYIPLRSLYSNGDYFEACEAAADLIYHTTASWYDAHCDYTQSTPRFGSTIWNQGYLGVMRCNAIYAAIERAPLTEQEKAPLLAECVVLRAFYYYILTINFGDVPYYFEEVTDANNDRIATLPRMSAKDLRTILMDELEYWLLEKQALPYIKTYDPANNYRIGAMVGLVIGGKLALWNNRYDRAITFLEPVERVYASHAYSVDEEGKEHYAIEDVLLPYPIKDIMFRNRYTAESIFELPGYAKDYGFKVTQSLSYRCMPSRKSNVIEGSEDGEIFEEDETEDLSVKSDIYDGISIPELGENARTTTAYRPNPYLYQTLMPAKSTDKRRAVYDPIAADSKEMVEIEDGGGWLAWCYKGRPVVLNKVDMSQEPGIHFFGRTKKSSGEPYLGDKFWCPGMVYTQDSNNLKIFRFAHVILDLAEANMRVGNWDEAFKYLNATIKRAGLINKLEGGHTDEDLFMKALQDESARELFGEFTRRHNLVRWGVWHDQIAKYSKDSRLKTNVAEAPCREYYPIPDTQVILSGYNLRNEEYEKWGM